MEQIVMVEDHKLIVKEWEGQRVLTFKDIDLVHSRPEGTANRNFRSNRDKFIEGQDYVVATRSYVGTKFVLTYVFSNKAPKGTLLTESGYLMLVKSLNDDLAWEVQRMLVNNYFQHKELKKILNIEKFITLTHNGYKFYFVLVDMEVYIHSKAVSEYIGKSTGFFNNQFKKHDEKAVLLVSRSDLNKKDKNNFKTNSIKFVKVDELNTYLNDIDNFEYKELMLWLKSKAVPIVLGKYNVYEEQEIFTKNLKGRKVITTMNWHN